MKQKIKHIKQSITKAIDSKSKLIPSILSMKGMSSVRVRHLLNNILNIPDVNYLEIGVCQGSTFISALYKNKVNSAYAIDDWSLYAAKNAKRRFMGKCKKFEIYNFTFFGKDAFHINLEKIKHKINIYFYDADHSEECTAHALSYFYSILADEFIFIVDDFDWESPFNGTFQGIKECKLKILYHKHLKSDNSNWWNGIGLFVLSK